MPASVASVASVVSVVSQPHALKTVQLRFDGHLPDFQNVKEVAVRRRDEPLLSCF